MMLTKASIRLPRKAPATASWSTGTSSTPGSGPGRRPLQVEAVIAEEIPEQPEIGVPVRGDAERLPASFGKLVIPASRARR